MVPETVGDAGAEALREELDRTRAALAASQEQVATWRAAALERWSESLRDIPTTAGGELALLRREIDTIHRSTSWRLSRPIRVAGTAAKALRRRR